MRKLFAFICLLTLVLGVQAQKVTLQGCGERYLPCPKHPRVKADVRRRTLHANQSRP